MSRQDEQYTPSEDLIIEAWKRYSGAQDAKYARLSDGDAVDEARRFIAKVRREAAIEALMDHAAELSETADLNDGYPEADQWRFAADRAWEAARYDYPKRVAPTT